MTDLHDLDRGFELEDEPHPECIVVYTESEDDAAFYNCLIGSGLRRIIRFTAPKGNKGWSGAVAACEAKRRISRDMGLPETRYWCLLDGEEAVRWGHTGFELLQAKSLLFRLEDPAADGMIFLNCYEKENLYLLYGSAVEDIRYRLASRRPKEMAAKHSPSDLTKPNYDAACNHRLEKHSEHETTTCRPPDRVFGPHNVWHAMTRSLLSAGLHAACKRPEGRNGKSHKPFVTDLTSLNRRRGRIFEDTIYSRLGAYRLDLRSARSEQLKRNHEEVGEIEEPARFDDNPQSARDRITIDFWRELYSNYRIIKGNRGKTIRQDPFAREWIRLCDGKSLLSWIFEKNPKLWEKAYERQLIENGFGEILRSALFNVLLVEPPRTRAPNGVRLSPRVRVRPPPTIHPLSIARR